MKRVRILLGSGSNNRNVLDPPVLCGVPDLQVVGAMLATAVSEGYGQVELAGGEPTLRRDLLRIVAASRGLGLAASLWTNGRIFSYADVAKRFFDSGVSSLTVGLCGPDAEVHDRVVGGQAFDQTVAGIRNAVDAGMQVAVDVPVCRDNVLHLAGTGLLAARLGATRVCFRLIEAGSEERIALVPDLRQAAAGIVAAVSVLERDMPGVVTGYADFPCCLLPSLKGRDMGGPRASDLIFLDPAQTEDAAGIRLERAGEPCRAVPVPCVSCELRRGCSTVEPALVATRGSGDLYLPVQSVSDISFTKVGLLDKPVIVDGVCPWFEGPITDVPSLETLHLVRDGRTELWKLSAGSRDASTLMHAKNIRCNLVMSSDGRVPRLHNVCFKCENLSRCAAVFELDADCDVLESPVPHVVTSGDASFDYLKWPDFQAGFCDFLAASGDKVVRFQGNAPIVRLVEDGDDVVFPGDIDSVEPTMLWEAVRKAARCELVDYNLPFGKPAFSLDVRSCDRFAEVDRMGTILIIRKCTMNCIICQVQKYYEGIDVMPLPDVVRFLEEFRLLGYTRLDLFGGEPTIRKDLVDLVYFAHRMGFYTDLITNGTLMDDALATGLRDAGLDLCIVSLDGPTPEIHDKIRRVKDGHRRAIAGIEAAVRAGGMEVNVDTVVLPDNVDHLIDLAHQVSETGVTRINMFLCLEGPISSPVPRLLGYEKTLDFYERIIPEMKRIGEPHGTSISVGPRLPMAGRSIREVAATRMFKDVCEGTYNVTYNHPEILCKAPDDEVYISLFGDVFPCTAPQMLETSANMGNVYKNKLIEVVRSEKWDQFRKIAGHHEGCRMCWRAHFDLDREGEERILDAE